MDRQLIKGAGQRAGLELDSASLEAVAFFIERLKEANRHVNLTAITDDEAIASLHLEDSWHLSSHIAPGSRLVDVGTGAGFPGLALRLVRPDLDVTLLDSTRKKINFLEETIQALGLDGVKALHGRAEELGRDALHRDSYDLALARAVSSLPVLAELCLPLVKKGGLFIAMKGEADESQEASKAIRSLKGQVEDRILYHLPGLDQARSLVLIRKTAATPGRYPRRMAQIHKSPL